MRRSAVVLFALLIPQLVHAATFVVNSTGDAGDASAGNGTCATAGSVCTLRAAIQEANALAGPDTINFSIGTGPQTIAPATDLTAITTQLTIDGTTQPAPGTTPRITIDGTNTRTLGLDVNMTTGALPATIRGLEITRFTTAGIKATLFSDTLTVESCYVTDNGGDGMWIITSDLGGSQLKVGNDTGGGNVISGNADMALDLFDNGGAGAKLGTFTVQGNIIGLAPDGMTAMPNVSGGIRTNLQFGNLTIGGSPAARNVISGNGGSGYITQGFLQADNFIFSDNYVGVAQDGITPRGNNGTGAILVARQYTVDSNIFAANTGAGVTFATCNLPSSMTANRVGVALDGSAQGNGGSGISVSLATGSRIFIGGAGADQNIIMNNGAGGVRVSGSGLAEIAENSIHNNTGLGIDLGAAGVVDANDPLDADTSSGNNLQNHPDILSAIRSGGTTTILGSLSSAASATYTIRFFASPSADPTGFGEGETYLGSVSITTNALGNGSFNLTTTGALVGSFVTATATTGGGDTSEFSNALAVTSPGEVLFAPAAYPAGESGTVTLTVQRVNGSAGAVSVNWATSNGTAGGTDFTAASGVLNFANGETSKTIAVTILPDTIDEAAETFNVTLSGPGGGVTLGSPAVATVTITDDDPPPALDISDASMPEGDLGIVPLSFNVTLSAASEQTVSVDFSSSNGTATAGSDFNALGGTITFSPGQQFKTVAIPIIGDTAIELDETFTVTLANPLNATIATGTATGTITNDDGAPAITINDVAVIEGNTGTTTALFTATLSGPATATVTVNWSTSDGTATAGTDYESGSGSLSFAPGETSKTIAVTIDGDVLVENNETFLVNLAGPANATLGDAQGGGTIADDDGTPAISVNDPAVVEGVAAIFTVMLAPASTLPVSVTWTTSDGSALTGSDYTGGTATLNFAPGETSKTVSIPTVNDGVAETSEQFTMTLSAPSGAMIGDATATATIIDDDGLPRVTIGNASAAEGNAGASSMTFTIDLSHASASSIDVTWTTADNSAAAGADYTAGGATITFLPGETSKTLAVSILGDAIVEADETFFVDITGATNATVTDAQGAGTITNDDGAVAISISDVANPEGTGGSTTFAFNVSLSAASSMPVSVQWATADGTAQSASDYTAGAGNILFAPGEIAKTIPVAVNPDAGFEANETFTVNLIGATNATIADAQAVGTITNDDAAPAVPSISIAAQSGTEGNAGTTSMTFAVTLDVPTSNIVTVSYSTGAGTATAGADYVATNGTLTFAPGVTTQNIVVPVIGDTLVEGSETFSVTLSAPSNATLGTSAATGTILDDDTAPIVPSISISGAAAGEGNVGSTSMTFTVQLNAATVATVTVDYSTGGGTATAGTDYVPVSGTLIFTPGVTAQNVVVAVIGDSLVEGNETLIVTLSAPVNGVLGTSAATGTIVDDDSAPAVPAVSIAGGSVVEGNTGSATMTFAVTLDVPTTVPVAVNYATGAGTATAGSDYVATSGTLTFAPGVTTQNITVPVIGDGLVEGNETFLVTLSAPGNATLGTSTATGTILDDDSAPTVPSITIAGASLAEGNAGSTNMAFAVTLSAPTVATVTVSYATGGGTATAATDYASTTGTLTFAPGATTQSIFVPVIGDALVEGNETFVVTLSAPGNGTLGTATATGTIIDDDSASAVPSISIGDVAQFEGSSGATLFVFPVALNTAGTTAVSVAWSAVPGTAIAGSDFLATNGTLVFAPGMTAQTVSIAVVGDANVESDETFSVRLSTPVNATIADDTGAAMIRNDDHPVPQQPPPPPTPTLRSSGVSVVEGSDGPTRAIVALTLSAPATAGASVRWMTRGGTATGGSDFAEASGRVTFGMNTAASIEIQIAGDRIDESDESFVVELFEPQGLVLIEDRATITILDDDDPPSQRAIVLAVGSLRGAAGSHFGTAAQMINVSNAPAAGSLLFRPAGATDASRDVTVPYALGPRELRAIDDVLAENGMTGLATLDVIPSTGPVPRMIVRIYDDGNGHGTTGFTLPVVTPADALAAGEEGLLVPPDDPMAMRFNVGVRTLDDGAAITIEVRDRTGAVRHEATREYVANWFNQIGANDFAGIALASGDYLVIRVARGSAILYGATIDNLTNDASVQLVTRGSGLSFAVFPRDVEF